MAFVFFWHFCFYDHINKSVAAYRRRRKEEVKRKKKKKKRRRGRKKEMLAFCNFYNSNYPNV